MRTSRDLARFIAICVVAGTLLGVTSAAEAVSIKVGSASGVPGTRASLPVTLSSTGESVAGVQNDLTFDRGTPIVSCALNGELAGPLSTVVLQPAGCTPGKDCASVRAVIVRIPPLPIADGSTLYTCEVDIPANANAGKLAIPCSAARASDGSGHALSTACSNGEVAVTGASTGSGGGCDVAGRSAGEPGWAALLGPAVFLWRRRARPSAGA